MKESKLNQIAKDGLVACVDFDVAQLEMVEPLALPVPRIMFAIATSIMPEHVSPNANSPG